jgi:hypothetical protein
MKTFLRRRFFLAQRPKNILLSQIIFCAKLFPEKYFLREYFLQKQNRSLENFYPRDKKIFVFTNYESICDDFLSSGVKKYLESENRKKRQA